MDHGANATSLALLVDDVIHYVATNTFPLVSRNLLFAGNAIYELIPVYRAVFTVYFVGLVVAWVVYKSGMFLVMLTRQILLVSDKVVFPWLVVSVKVVKNFVLESQLHVGLELVMQRRETLSTDDVKAIEDYTGNGYKAMNAQLRSGRQNQAVEKRIVAVEKAMDKLKVYKGKVFRGVAGLPQAIRKKLVPGAAYSDFAFCSTSKLEEKAFKSAGKKAFFLFEIESKTGVEIQAHSKFQHEAEVLFRPGTPFKIKRVVGRRVFMEEMAH
jgi:hypothetical protein